MKGPKRTRAAWLALACSSIACGDPSADDEKQRLAAGDAGDAAPAFLCTSSGAVAEMATIPAGEFIMGCNAAHDDECLDDELPMRRVNVKEFEIDRTEVTQDHYAACVIDGVCPAPECAWDCSAGSRPAACVSRKAAKAYCGFVGKHLPTEAQWEKAARGTDGRKYPWGNAPPSCALLNMSGCAGQPVPAGSKPRGASPYGALDMAGNLVEMVADYYAPAYYSVAPDLNPRGPTVGSRHVGRGGGWRSGASKHRASARQALDPAELGEWLGFRCAR
jgi:formylglycine-generating enzyme